MLYNDFDLCMIKEIEMQKAKWLPKEGLQIAVKRREVKSKGEKERHTHLNAEFQISGRDKMWKRHQMWKRHVHPNVHYSTVYNSQDMEAT